MFQTLFITTVLCVYISVKDIFYRRISNVSCLIILLLSLIYGHGDVGLNIFYYVFIAFGAYFLNVVAAGDTKLFVCFLFGIDSGLYLLTLFLVLFFGGLVGLLYKVIELCGCSGNNIKTTPYGLPICIGCMFSLVASM